MTRRLISAALAAALVLLATGASAQGDPSARVLADLTGAGYEVSEMRRTLLGRVRIVAERDNLRREIVLDPRNGVILRDYVFMIEDGDGEVSPVGTGSGSSGGGREAGDDDDDRDDDDDDDDDDDNGGDDDDGGDDGGDEDDGGDDDDD